MNTSLTLADWKDVAAIVGTILAAAVLMKGVIEYVAQGAQKRADRFFDMRKRLKDNVTFREICALVEHDDPALEGIPFKDKRDFLGLFEEVALLVNTGLMRPALAHYMFGYYAVRCWRSDHFWKGVNRRSEYWGAFRDFAERMLRIERSFRFRRRRFKV